MIVYFNGRWIPEAEAVVPVADRSFLYGDGLFETILVWKARPIAWRAHWRRLEGGARFLRIALPFDERRFGGILRRLVVENDAGEAALRVTVSRGVGSRGYSPKSARDPAVLVHLHPIEPDCPDRLRQWRLVISSHRLDSGSALLRFKTNNRLANVLAKSEAEELGADEALFLNERGEIAEATSANVFWFQGGVLFSPPEDAGFLPGITRQKTLELARELGWRTAAAPVHPDELAGAEGTFLTLSTLGIVEAISLNGVALSRHAATLDFFRAYWKTVRKEAEAAQNPE